MSLLKHFVAGPFQTNAYVVGSNDSEDVVLIDSPPESYQHIKSYIASSQRHLAAVLITHPHLDHIMDAPRFAEDNVPLIAMEDAVWEVAHPQSLNLFQEPDAGFSGASVDQCVKHGQVLELAGLQFRVLSVPGHCEGSAAYHVESASLCFVGDLLFRGSIGRTDLPGGDFDRLAESIQNHIYTMRSETLLLPGHGPVTEVGSEKHSNPYVRG